MYLSDHSKNLISAEEKVAELIKQRDQLRAELAAARQRETIAIASWDEERNRALREGERVVEWRDRAESAEAELAKERARLDWLEKQDGGFCHTKWGEYQNYWGPAFPTKLRAAIDAEMKEGAK